MSNFHQQAIAVPEPNPLALDIGVTAYFSQYAPELLTKQERRFYTVMCFPYGIREEIMYRGPRGISKEDDYNFDVLSYLLAEILWRSPKNRKYAVNLVRRRKRQMNKILKRGL